MKKSDVLKQERAAIEAKIEALVSKATRSESDDAEFDTLRTELEGMNRKIEREEAAEKFLATRADSAPVIHEKKTTPADYSFQKAIREMVFNNGVLTGLEAEMHQEARRENPGIKGIGIPSFVLNRTDPTGLFAASSAVVATNTVDFIDALRAKLVVVQAGARLMSGLTGNISIPRLTGGSVTWPGETGDTSDFGAVFDAVTMSPKRATAYQELSKQLLIQSTYDVEQIIRGDMVRAIALAVDAAAIEGGATGMPTGILMTSGIGEVKCDAASGAAITWQDIIDLEKEIAVDNADMGSLAFLTNPKVRGQLKNTHVGTDQRMIWSENGNSLMGYPAFVTTQVPSDLEAGDTTGCSAVIFGNFSDLILGQWGGLDITVDPYTAAKSAQVKVYIDSFWDVAVRHPESFAAIKDAITT